MGGHIRPRNGRYQAIVAVGRRNNKTVYQSETFDDKKEAARWIRQQETKRDAKKPIVLRNRITLREFVPKWETWAKAELSPKTRILYSCFLNKYILPELGETRLQDLEAPQVQDFFDKLPERLAANSRAICYATLRQVLKVAQTWRLVEHNVCKDIAAPKRVEAEIDPPDDKTMGELLRALKDTALWLPCLMAWGTGLRRGELLGLRWSDVDLGDEPEVRVSRSLHQAGNELWFGACKTKKSRRTVPLPDVVAATLREHKKEQAEQRLSLGEKYHDQGLIFSYVDGSPWKPQEFSTSFHWHTRHKGFPHVRFHDLRHAAASTLLRANVHPKIVQERLGHSTISITLDTYSHIVPSMQREAAQTMNDVLERVS